VAVDRWREAWRRSERPAFHRDSVPDDLVAFHDDVLGAAERVLVPLSGRSLDLAWLAEPGARGRRRGDRRGGMGRRHLPARPAVSYGTGVLAGGGAPASSPLRSRLRVAQSEARMAVPRITTTTPSVIQTGGS
jgi:hypothetical protein